MISFNDYQKAAHKTSNVPDPAIVYCTLALNGEAGEIAEKVKKHLRDGTPLDRDAMIRELGDVLWYIAEMATHLHADMNTVARVNLDKLASRAERGVLGGSGDNR